MYSLAIYLICIYFLILYLYIYMIKFTGIIQFNPTCSPLMIRAIAPFWADIDLRYGGNLSYRQSSNAPLLTKATDEIAKAFPDLVEGLNLQWLFITTWDSVPYNGAQDCTFPDQGLAFTNTFQVILASDGTYSFVIYFYNNITWTTGTYSGGDRCTGHGGMPAKAGFDYGDGTTFFDVAGTCTPEIVNVEDTSNVNEAGNWIWRVDNTFEVPNPMCLEVFSPENGTFQLHDYFEGSVVTFNCFEGFELVGPYSLTCRSTENNSSKLEWDGEVPACNQVQTTSYLFTCINSTISWFCQLIERSGDGAISVLIAMMLMLMTYSPHSEIEELTVEPEGIGENEFSPPPLLTPLPPERGEKVYVYHMNEGKKSKRVMMNEPMEIPRTIGAPKRKRALAMGSTVGSNEQLSKMGNYRNAAAKCLTVRVTYSDTSRKALSAEDARGLREAIKERVATHVGVALQFEETVEANGHLFIYCGTKETKEWTVKIIPVVLDGKFCVFDNVKLRIWIGGVAKPDPNGLFSQLGKQNGLNTSQWSWLSTTHASKGGFNISFRVSEETLTILLARGMFLYYGLSRVTIHKVIKAKRSARTMVEIKI